MCDKIKNLAKCEVHSLIRFLNAKKSTPYRNCKQITEVYGNMVKEASVRNRCIISNSGRMNIYVEKRLGRPTVVTDEIK